MHMINIIVPSTQPEGTSEEAGAGADPRMLTSICLEVGSAFKCNK